MRCAVVEATGCAGGCQIFNDVLDVHGRSCGILAQWLPENQAVVIGRRNLRFVECQRHERAAALADYGVDIPAQEFVVTARQRLLSAVEHFATSQT